MVFFANSRSFGNANSKSDVLYFTLIAALLLLLVATACDFRTREIPDWISIAIAFVAVTAASAGWLGIGLLLVASGGALGLLIGYGLYRFARLGGGDAKLIAALGLLVGPVGLLIVLFGMAIAGGILSVIAIYRKQKDYAYVPAITAGFVWYLALVSRL
jgi:prepilin peptidase CpaA